MPPLIDIPIAVNSIVDPVIFTPENDVRSLALAAESLPREDSAVSQELQRAPQ
uniref:Uncharacterized protein n=1 Tax=Acrobeloides nanus TaxID=290746 RepID=A0A914DLA9_9BILA